MNQQTKNVLVATFLSLLVVLVWDKFYAAPHFEKQRQIEAEMQARQAQNAQAPGQQAANSQLAQPQGSRSNAPVMQAPPAATKSREEALAESPRIAIDTPAIYGSIALKGARIDDVSFKGYRESVDPKSANIVLLSPLDSPYPYYAELGYIPDPGASFSLPGGPSGSAPGRLPTCVDKMRPSLRFMSCGSPRLFPGLFVVHFELDPGVQPRRVGRKPP